MRKIVYFTLLLALVSSSAAFAREPKATLYSNVAKNVVKGMYSRPGDRISLKLTAMNEPANVQMETWEVTLTNKANVGSAIYSVTVVENEATGENSEVANISVKYVAGN